jgi:tellurite resistance protein TerC
MEMIVWLVFIALALAMFWVDLRSLRPEATSIGLALTWTLIWFASALVFTTAVYVLYEQGCLPADALFDDTSPGREAAIQFFTAFLVIKTLSVDNVFVIAVIFSSLAVPLAAQHRVLFWGVLGAVVSRGVIIGAGAFLIARIPWVVYGFGMLLLIAATRILVLRHDNIKPSHNLFVRLARRRFPLTQSLIGDRFFVCIDAKQMMTPLLVALLLVISGDLWLSVDAIPASFAITADPFIIFAANVFALVGLRSLYFAVAAFVERFHYLRASLVFVLAFVGVKMMLWHHYQIPSLVSLAIVAGLLAVGILATVAAAPRATVRFLSPLVADLERIAVMTYRQARRIVVLLVGSTILLVGVIMIVTPGPAVVVIPLGLAVLGAEFAWARRWLKRFGQAAGKVAGRCGK